MEKFVSRRQYSDSKLHVLPSPKGEKEGANHLQSHHSHGDVVEEKERRSFKWRSRFSTPKISTAHSAPSPVALFGKKHARSEVNIRIIDNGYIANVPQRASKTKDPSPDSDPFCVKTTRGRIRHERKSAHLEPVIEDVPAHFLNSHSREVQGERRASYIREHAKVRAGVTGKSAVISASIEAPETGVGISRSMRPFSMIESAEYEGIMRKRQASWASAFAIDKGNQQKFEEYIRLHEEVANFDEGGVDAPGKSKGRECVDEDEPTDSSLRRHDNPIYTGVSTLRRPRKAISCSHAQASPIPSAMPVIATRVRKRNLRQRAKRRQTTSVHAGMLPGRSTPTGMEFDLNGLAQQCELFCNKEDKMATHCEETENRQITSPAHGVKIM